MARSESSVVVELQLRLDKAERQLAAFTKKAERTQINLKGIDSRKFTQPLGKITGSVSEFNKSLEASNARVIAFTASAGVLFTVTRAFQEMARAAIDVEKTLMDVNVILGQSQRNLKQFGGELFKIAKQTGQSFYQVGEAAAEFARQGLSMEKTLTRTRDALILMRLSGMDAESAVNSLTAAINSFNKTAITSTEIVNKMANVDAAFAVSTNDLAEAIRRVGASAEGVNVNFNQLLAAVTSVQQTTARGGNVIGNSLKTIFTRIQRTEVINQLNSLGVSVRTLAGDMRPAMQVLTDLAKAYDGLNPTLKAQTAELVGGVYQMNILKALLKDLSSGYSVYSQALHTANSATDEALRRNEELNKTMAAMLNETLQNLTKMGSEMGKLTFEPVFKKLLGSFNKLAKETEVFGDVGMLFGISDKEASDYGKRLGEGIFKSIGNFLQGPGLVALIAIAGKLFIDFTKFLGKSTIDMMNLNKTTQQQAVVQEHILGILSQSPQLVAAIESKERSRLSVEEQILKALKQEIVARERIAALSKSMSGGVMAGGITAKLDKGSGTSTLITRSAGHIPNFRGAASEVMGAISGGYSPGRIKERFIPNYGRVMYNDAEKVKYFPNFKQPAIMPPAGSAAGKAYKSNFKSQHGFNPYASSGFMPNMMEVLTSLRTIFHKKGSGSTGSMDKKLSISKNNLVRSQGTPNWLKPVLDYALLPGEMVNLRTMGQLSGVTKRESAGFATGTGRAADLKGRQMESAIAGRPGMFGLNQFQRNPNATAPKTPYDLGQRAGGRNFPVESKSELKSKQIAQIFAKTLYENNSSSLRHLRRRLSGKKSDPRAGELLDVLQRTTTKAIGNRNAEIAKYTGGEFKSLQDLNATMGFDTRNAVAAHRQGIFASGGFLPNLMSVNSIWSRYPRTRISKNNKMVEGNDQINIPDFGKPLFFRRNRNESTNQYELAAVKKYGLKGNDSLQYGTTAAIDGYKGKTFYEVKGGSWNRASVNMKYARAVLENAGPGGKFAKWFREGTRRSVDAVNLPAPKLIAATSGGPFKKSGGFVPNMSPLADAMRAEKKGGKGAEMRIDPRTGLMYVAQPGQPKDLRRLIKEDHPEGFTQALVNSRRQQGKHAGHIPNFQEGATGMHAAAISGGAMMMGFGMKMVGDAMKEAAESTKELQRKINKAAEEEQTARRKNAESLEKNQRALDKNAQSIDRNKAKRDQAIRDLRTGPVGADRTAINKQAGIQARAAAMASLSAGPARTDAYGRPVPVRDLTNMKVRDMTTDEKTAYNKARREAGAELNKQWRTAKGEEIRSIQQDTQNRKGQIKELKRNVIETKENNALLDKNNRRLQQQAVEHNKKSGWGGGLVTMGGAKPGQPGFFKRTGNFMQNQGAMAGMMMLPMVEGLVRAGGAQDRASKMRSDIAVGGVSAGVGIGMMGAMMGGKGAVVGGIAGLVMAVDALDKAKWTQVPEFTANMEKAKQELTDFNNSSQKYLTSLEAFSQVMSDPNAKGEDILKRQQALNEAVMEIPSHLQAKIAAAKGDSEEIKKLFSEIQMDLMETARVTAAQLRIAQGREGARGNKSSAWQRQMRKYMGNPFERTADQEDMGAMDYALAAPAAMVSGFAKIADLFGADLGQREYAEQLNVGDPTKRTQFKAIFDDSISGKRIRRDLKDSIYREVDAEQLKGVEGQKNLQALQSFVKNMGEEMDASELEKFKKIMTDLGIPEGLQDEVAAYQRNQEDAAKAAKDLNEAVGKGVTTFIKTAQAAEHAARIAAVSKRSAMRLREFNEALKSVHSTLKTNIEIEKERAFVIAQMKLNRDQFRLDMASAVANKAFEGAKPFLSSGAEADMKMNLDIAKTQADMLKGIRNELQRTQRAQFDELNEQFMKAGSALEGLYERQLSQPDTSATFRDIARNQELQKNLAQIAQEHLQKIKDRPNDIEDMHPELISRFAAAIGEATGKSGQVAADLIASKLEKINGTFTNKLTELMDTQFRQELLLRAQNAMEQQRLQQEQRLQAMGGATDYLGSPSSTGVSGNLNKINNTLSQMRATLLGESKLPGIRGDRGSIRQGRFAFGVLDNMINGMNIRDAEGRRMGPQAFGGLGGMAIRGRAEDMRIQLERQRQILSYMPGGLTPQMEAGFNAALNPKALERTAVEQVASQLKWQELPQSVADMNSSLKALNQIISSQNAVMEIKNQKAFSTALKQAGLHKLPDNISKIEDDVLKETVKFEKNENQQMLNKQLTNAKRIANYSQKGAQHVANTASKANMSGHKRTAQTITTGNAKSGALMSQGYTGIVGTNHEGFSRIEAILLQIKNLELARKLDKQQVEIAKSMSTKKAEWGNQSFSVYTAADVAAGRATADQIGTLKPWAEQKKSMDLREIYGPGKLKKYGGLLEGIDVNNVIQNLKYTKSGKGVDPTKAKNMTFDTNTSAIDKRIQSMLTKESNDVATRNMAARAAYVLRLKAMRNQSEKVFLENYNRVPAGGRAIKPFGGGRPTGGANALSPAIAFERGTYATQVFQRGQALSAGNALQAAQRIQDSPEWKKITQGRINLPEELFSVSRGAKSQNKNLQLFMKGVPGMASDVETVLNFYNRGSRSGFGGGGTKPMPFDTHGVDKAGGRYMQQYAMQRLFEDRYGRRLAGGPDPLSPAQTPKALERQNEFARKRLEIDKRLLDQQKKVREGMVEWSVRDLGPRNSQRRARAKVQDDLITQTEKRIQIYQDFLAGRRGTNLMGAQFPTSTIKYGEKKLGVKGNASEPWGTTVANRQGRTGLSMMLEEFQNETVAEFFDPTTADGKMLKDFILKNPEVAKKMGLRYETAANYGPPEKRDTTKVKYFDARKLISEKGGAITMETSIADMMKNADLANLSEVFNKGDNLRAVQPVFDVFNRKKREAELKGFKEQFMDDLINDKDGPMNQYIRYMELEGDINALLKQKLDKNKKAAQVTKLIQNAEKKLRNQQAKDFASGRVGAYGAFKGGVDRKIQRGNLASVIQAFGGHPDEVDITRALAQRRESNILAYTARGSMSLGASNFGIMGGNEQARMGFDKYARGLGLGTSMFQNLPGRPLAFTGRTDKDGNPISVIADLAQRARAGATGIKNLTERSKAEFAEREFVGGTGWDVNVLGEMPQVLADMKKSGMFTGATSPQQVLDIIERAGTNLTGLGTTFEKIEDISKPARNAEEQVQKLLVIQKHLAESYADEAAMNKAKARMLEDASNNALIGAENAAALAKLNMEFDLADPTKTQAERRASVKTARTAAITAGKFKEGFKLTFKEIGESWKKSSNEMANEAANGMVAISDTLQGGINDAVWSWIKGTKSIKESFGDLFQSIGDMAAKMVIKMALQQFIFNPMANMFNKGGYIDKGQRGKDTVPALLSKGEYVLRASAVDKVGRGTLEQINSGGKGYNLGGLALSSGDNTVNIAHTKELIGILGGSRSGQSNSAGIGIGRATNSKQYDPLFGGVDPQAGLSSIRRGGAGFASTTLKNAYIYDKAGSRYEIDRRLSRMALGDDSNPRNRFRMDKAKGLMDARLNRYNELKEWQASVEKARTKRRKKMQNMLWMMGGIMLAHHLASGTEWGKAQGFRKPFGATNNKFGQGVRNAPGRFWNWAGGLFGGGGPAAPGAGGSIAAGQGAPGMPAAEFGAQQKFLQMGFRNQGGSIADTEFAMLSKGEYVMPADTVNRLGIDFFERLNKQGKVSGYAQGGYVGSTAGPAGDSGAYGASTNNITINVNVDQSGATTSTTAEGSGLNQESAKQLGTMIKQQVMQTLVTQKRVGGILYDGNVSGT